MVAAILNLKKCTRGIFGASSEFVWGDVQVSFLKKSAFCNFIPGSCVFFTNALALEAVDWCICFTRKIQHGGDWQRSRPQDPKNVHAFLMTARPLSWACGHGTEMSLILKNYFRPDYSPIYLDMRVQRNVPRFCMQSICGWNRFQPVAREKWCLAGKQFLQMRFLVWCLCWRSFTRGS